MSAAECGNCGAALPADSRFCPECGARVGADTGETAVQDVPPHEVRPGPVDIMWSERRFFGVPPSTALFGLGIAGLVLGVVLLVTGHPVWALAAFAAAVLALMGFVSQTRRLPAEASGVARASMHAFGAVKARAGATIDTVSAHGSARLELMRLRREADQLAEVRERALRDLGAAFYDGDKRATQELKERVARIDERREAKEDEMARVTAQTEERVKQAQLQAQATQIVRPAETPDQPPESAGPSGTERGRKKGSVRRNQ